MIILRLIGVNRVHPYYHQKTVKWKKNIDSLYRISHISEHIQRVLKL